MFVPFAGKGRSVPGGRGDGCDISRWDRIVSGRESPGDPGSAPVRRGGDPGPGWGDSRDDEHVREWKGSEDGDPGAVVCCSGPAGEAGTGGEGEERGGVWCKIDVIFLLSF
ncbi:hypothetical protein DSECCO2_68190 [anaerobic digester metagenome]